MAGKFIFKKFSEIELDDPFFDALKSDYPGNPNSTGFVEWFCKKAAANSTALVFDDDEGLGAFVYLKDENEPIELVGRTLPAIPRIKIGTLRLAPRYRGQRLGEGAIGLALWKWQKTKREEVYVSIFEKHDMLIGQLERFGFIHAGNNLNGERIYVKSRRNVDYSDPYKSFPFINPSFQNAGYLIVDDVYHDTLFPYSELKNTLQEQIALSVANGISKIYVGSQMSLPPYRIGEPILIYRKYTGTAGSPGHKSCITTYCVVTNVIIAKENNKYKMSIDDLLKHIGNKSVFNEDEIRTKYCNERTLVIIEMLYYGFFGAGHNVNWVWLKNNNFWPSGYPTTARLTQTQFQAILKEGSVDVSNVIIN
jgi:GNAT superfamily N-acetyltransferase